MTRLLVAVTAVLVLAACGGIPAEPTTPPADTEPVAAPGHLDFDVRWNDRTDFEKWEPPLPPGEDGWLTEPPSRWPEVRARLVLPASVAPGTLVEYVLVLRNISGHPVDLRPCGGYVQEIRNIGPGLAAESMPRGSSSYRLNCDGDPVLAPGASRRYEMRMHVPVGVSGEEVLVGWRFVDDMPDREAQLWVPLGE